MAVFELILFSCVVNVPMNWRQCFSWEENKCTNNPSPWSSQPPPDRASDPFCQVLSCESSWLHGACLLKQGYLFRLCCFKKSPQIQGLKITQIHHLLKLLQPKPSEFEWILCLGSYKREGSVGRTEFVIGACRNSFLKFIWSLRLQSFSLIFTCCPPAASPCF